MNAWLADPYSTLMLIAAIVAVGAISAGLEGLALWRAGAYGAAGVWPWPLLRTVGRGTFFHWVPIGVADQVLLTLLLARIGAAVALIGCAASELNPLLPLILLITIHIVLHRRSTWGGEGGDQMMLIVFTVTLIAAAAPRDSSIALACVLFVAGQITLAYVASGTAKCFGPLWRQGKALSKIMNQYAYGREDVARLLAARPRSARLICYAVIGFQLSFPMFFVLPMPGALAYLFAGVLFHAGIAYVMRLNLFLPAFVGTYPSLLFVHRLLWG